MVSSVCAALTMEVLLALLSNTSALAFLARVLNLANIFRFKSQRITPLSLQYIHLNYQINSFSFQRMLTFLLVMHKFTKMCQNVWCFFKSVENINYILKPCKRVITIQFIRYKYRIYHSRQNKSTYTNCYYANPAKLRYLVLRP